MNNEPLVMQMFTKWWKTNWILGGEINRIKVQYSMVPAALISDSLRNFAILRLDATPTTTTTYYE
jgi:hypothetical protein